MLRSSGRAVVETVLLRFVGSGVQSSKSMLSRIQVTPAIQGQKVTESQQLTRQVHKEPALDKCSEEMKLEGHDVCASSVPPVPIHMPEEDDHKNSACECASDN